MIRLTSLRQARPDRLKGRPGFSLVEVLIAMILLIIAAVSISSYMLTTASARLTARQKAYAMVLVQETIDSIRTLGFDNAQLASRQSVRTVGELALTVRTTVVSSQPTSKVVDVSVTTSQNRLLQRFITSLYDESR